MKHSIIITAMLMTIIGTAPAIARDHAPDREQGQRRGPPQVALNACTTASSGDSCSFTGRRDETIAGTCEAVHGDQLACVPEGGPPGMRPGQARHDY